MIKTSKKPTNIKQGYVYLIQAGESFVFKIGCSSQPNLRLKQLQGGSSELLTILCQKKCRDMYLQEKRWHTKFGVTRKHGEWFSLDEKQLPKIVSFLKGDIGIHFKDRKTVNLEVGRKYYISFDSKKVEEVILLELPIRGGHPTISVRNLKTGGVNSLFPDEIRDSAISALFNRVTC